METVSGTARQVRYGSEVYGNKEGVGTSHVTLFRLGNQAVQLSMPAMANIEEGDRIVVIGAIDEGTLIGRAYRNCETGAYGRWTRRSIIGLLFYYAMMFCFIGLALGLFASSFGRTGAILAILGTAAVTASYFLHAAVDEMRTRWAFWRVRSASSR